MKGGIELSLVLGFSMMLLALSISLVGVVMMYNHARMMQEEIISIIEHNNKYDQSIIQQIDEVKACKGCRYSVDYSEYNRYYVKVYFPIQVLFISLKTTGYVGGYTIPIA